MTKNQLEAQRIKTATRLSAISALEGDAYTDAIRQESETLEVEYRNVGAKLTALLAVEETEKEVALKEAAELGELGDSETRERVGTARAGRTVKGC